MLNTNLRSIALVLALSPVFTALTPAQALANAGAVPGAQISIVADPNAPKAEPAPAPSGTTMDWMQKAIAEREAKKKLEGQCLDQPKSTTATAPKTAPKPNKPKASNPVAKAPAKKTYKLNSGDTKVVVEKLPEVDSASVEIANGLNSKLGQFKSVAIGKLGSMIKRFKVRLDGNKPVISGLVDPECAKQMRIELDTPSRDEKEFVYALRVETADSISKTDPKNIFKKADDACSAEKARACDRDTCIDLSKNPEKVPGLQGALATTLELDSGNGEILLKYRTEDRSLPIDDENAIRFEFLPEQYGGRLAIETQALRDRKNRERDAIAKSEELMAMCERAEKGEYSAIQGLTDLLGDDVDSYKGLLTSARQTCVNNTMNYLNKQLDKASSIMTMTEIVSEAQDIVGDEEKSCGDENIRKTIATFLLEKVAAKANTLEVDESDVGQVIARNKLIEKAAQGAMTTAPSEKDLYRKARLVKGLSQFERVSTASKSPDFFDKSVIAEAKVAQKQTQSWANQNKKDKTINGLAGAWNAVMQPRYVNQYYGQGGYVFQAQTVGTGLDENNSIEIRKQIEERFNAYRQGLMQQNQNGGGGAGQINTSTTLSDLLGQK